MASVIVVLKEGNDYPTERYTVMGIIIIVVIVLLYFVTFVSYLLDTKSFCYLQQARKENECTHIEIHILI